MIPISESVNARLTPWVTRLLVVACILVFLYELLLPAPVLDRFIQKWGADPRLVLLALAGHPQVPRTELVTLFTSQFLHGGWLHLLGNMVVLNMKGKPVSVFGSYGWSGEAIKAVSDILTAMRLKVALEPIKVKMTPSGAELDQCFEFGKQFAAVALPAP